MVKFLRIFGGFDVSLAVGYFDFGADRDHDPDPGIINGIFTTVGMR